MIERGAVMTIFEAYNNTKKRLAAAGIEDSVFEAKAIIRHITGLSNTEILTSYMNELTEFQENNLTAIMRQREIRYPLQYIIGTWGFYKLCAGSGCIGISLAKDYPDSAVVMVEKFDEAIRYIDQNVKLNEAYNTLLIKGDVLEGDGKENKYDLIVSNPPYIPESEISLMNAETKFEPETALLSEGDGLKFYREIAHIYKVSLKDGGMLAFEVGYKQADSVCEILNQNGYKDVKAVKDYNGINRVVCAIK